MALRSPLSFPNKQLAYLLSKTMELQQIQQVVSRIIEPDLAPHVGVANYEGGALTLSTENGTWASRLRFALPDLLSRLRGPGQLYGLKHIKIMVIPNRVQAKATTKASVIELLENKTYGEDESSLQAALTRLATTLKRTEKTT